MSYVFVVVTDVAGPLVVCDGDVCSGLLQDVQAAQGMQGSVLVLVSTSSPAVLYLLPCLASNCTLLPLLLQTALVEWLQAACCIELLRNNSELQSQFLDV